MNTYLKFHLYFSRNPKKVKKWIKQNSRSLNLICKRPHLNKYHQQYDFANRSISSFFFFFTNKIYFKTQNYVDDIKKNSKHHKRLIIRRKWPAFSCKIAIFFSAGWGAPPPRAPGAPRRRRRRPWPGDPHLVKVYCLRMRFTLRPRENWTWTATTTHLSRSHFIIYIYLI